MWTKHGRRRWHGEVMAEKALKGVGAAHRAATAFVRTRSLAYLRLYVAAARSPFYVPGTFRFPFGEVQYVDIGSLPYLYYEIFVDGVYDVLGLGKEPVIIDCGGNVGMSTIRFKQLYPDARITVFEADPQIAGVLEKNVTGLELANVQVVSSAVSSVSGYGVFREDGAIGGRLIEEEDVSALRVATVRLCDYINTDVDVLKLDVEGAEFKVIEDLCDTGKIHCIRNIVCEVHGTGAVPDPTADLWTHLSQAGFRLSVNWAEAIDAKEDESERPPFAVLPTGHSRLLLYAWRA